MNLRVALKTSSMAGMNCRGDDDEINEGRERLYMYVESLSAADPPEPKSETQRKDNRVSKVESTTSQKYMRRIGPLRLRSEGPGQAEYYRPIKCGKSSLSSR